MKVVRNIADLKHLISAYKLEGKTIGFVPTMGALHDGHISLLNNIRLGFASNISLIIIKSVI